MSDTFQMMTWTLDGDPPRQGDFGIYLGPKDATDEPVIDAIQELDLREAFSEAFLPTDPRWFGLWVTSPLNRRQIELLLVWLTYMKTRMPIRCSDLFDDFLAALEEARNSGRSLYVEVSPPGHIDFGWHTVFVHCPRCMAEGPFERWQNSYPTEEIACPVCGFDYSPAATTCSSRLPSHIGESAICESCGKKITWEELSENEFDQIRSHRHFRRCDDELWFLNRVAALQEQTPALRGRKIPSFEPQRCDWDDVELCKWMTALPSDKMSHAHVPEEEWQAWSDEDRLVIEALLSEAFDLDARRQSLRWELDELAPQCMTNVACPRCGEPMNLPRQECRSGYQPRSAV